MADARISNSLSYFLEQALILEKNSLETVSKVSDAVTSQKDTQHGLKLKVFSNPLVDVK